MDRNRVVLGKMLEELKFLQEDVKNVDFDGFMNNERLKRSVAMTLINIGELVRHLEKDFRKSRTDLPFDDIIGLRDIAAHGYKTLRFDDIWELVQKDVPELKQKIKNIIG